MEEIVFVISWYTHLDSNSAYAYSKNMGMRMSFEDHFEANVKVEAEDQPEVVVEL